MTPSEALMAAAVFLFALFAFGPAVREWLRGDPLDRLFRPPKLQSDP